MATTDTNRRDGQPAAAPPTPSQRAGQADPGARVGDPNRPPAPGTPAPVPDPTPRRRRDKELATIERALQALDGDTQATAATSQCLAAMAGIGDTGRRAAIVDLLSLDPAGMRLAKVVLEDRWTRTGEAG
jgi:hypothetical protein